MTTPKHIIVALLALAISLVGCQKMQQNKLNRQMKKVAKTYLEQEQVEDYKNLTITSVDTLTEFGYAKLTSELLENMGEVNHEDICRIGWRLNLFESRSH